MHTHKSISILTTEHGGETIFNAVAECIVMRMMMVGDDDNASKQACRFGISRDVATVSIHSDP